MKGARPPAIRCPTPKGAWHDGTLRTRATAGVGVRGSEDRAVVLADRIGCRSRQAARGHSQSPGEEPGDPSSGLAPPRESPGGVKERRKPARGGKAAGTVAGSSKTRNCESGRLEHSVDGRRPGPGKLPLLTREQRKRPWHSSERSVTDGRGGATGRQRSITSLPRGRKRREQVAPPLQ